MFLADFDHVPHPAGYSREFFRNLLFGLDEPRGAPAGKPLRESVRECFLEVSNGALDTRGEVADWVRVPGKITEEPNRRRGMEPFGESWPVIVAETLRARGLVAKGAKEKLRLKNGRLLDLLVFLNTDCGVGGCNRWSGQLKNVLRRMNRGAQWGDA